MSDEASSDTGIGASVRRLEDRRLISGGGRFTDDIDLDDQLFAVFVRSAHAHARIVHIDTETVRGQPGVVAVITGRDLPSNALVSPDGIPQMVNGSGQKIFDPPHPVLAVDVVRYVGEPVAVVLAETLAGARDAAEQVEVECETWQHVVRTGDALREGAPVVWPELGGNLALDWSNGDSAKVDAMLVDAAKRVHVELVNNRVVPAPMEPRAAFALPDADSGGVTLVAPTQGGRRIQDMLARVLRMPVGKVRVVSHDTGGAFGIRSKLYPELVVVAWAAVAHRRPVRWRSDRIETFVSDFHGRDQINHAEMGLDADGRISALKVETILNLGAYLSEHGARLAVAGGGRIIPCGYDVRHFHFSVKPVFTNTVPTDSYRGAGRPEVNYLMEQLMDAAARECGLARDEVRRRNLVGPAQMPYRTQMGLIFDTGDFPGLLDKALVAADWNGFPARHESSEARGRLRGLGLAFFVESAGGRPSEEMRVVIRPDGTAEVYAGTYSQGQGHATAYAQLINEYLGVPLENVHLFEGDTETMPAGAVGTFGSRSSMMGGVGIKRACDELITRCKVIAARLLQTEPDAVTHQHGIFRSGAGSVDLSTVAKAAHDPASRPADVTEGLDATYRFKRPADSFNFPNGCHLCEVEVDPETGRVEMLAYTAVDDCGVVLNPMLVHGQLHGGIAQGVGQALLEEVLYDAGSGQLLTASFLDYGMPRAAHFPEISSSFANVPSITSELGVKGAGEAGVCAAPQALVSAVQHALEPYGATGLEMPLTPEKVWRAIASAKAAGRGEADDRL